MNCVLEFLLPLFQAWTRVIEANEKEIFFIFKVFTNYANEFSFENTRIIHALMYFFSVRIILYNYYIKMFTTFSFGCNMVKKQPQSILL